MSAQDPTHEALDALLEAVARDRDTRCKALADAARTQSDALLADARGHARRSVAEAVTSERRRDREADRLLQARIDTHHRLQQQRTQKRQLERAWSLLHGELLRRWQDPDARRKWVEAALRRCELVLTPDHWTVTHPPTWSETERSRTHAWLQERSGVGVAFEADGSIEAGLSVRRDQACFDATVDGLLAARHRIEAELLAELQPETETQAETDGEPSP